MSYVSVEEFAGYLRTGFDAEDAYSVQQYLDDATASIDDEIGFSLVSAAETVVLDGSGTSRLLLPHWPVTAVASVTITKPDGSTQLLVFGGDDDYTFTDSGILTRINGVWPCGDRNISVVDTAGYTTIPTAVKRICRRLTAAAWFNTAGADSEDSTDHRVKWHTPGAELSTGEKRSLSRYRAR